MLNGIGAGVGETIQPAVITDVMFLHDRGKQNTLYFSCYFAALMIGPIIAGPMAETVGWRNYWWLNVAILGVTLIITILGFPETMWHRPYWGDINGLTANSVGVVPARTADPKDNSMLAEKASQENVDVSKVETQARDPYLGKGKPARQQLYPFRPTSQTLKKLAIAFWTPWKLFVYPIVLFAAFGVSWSASSFLTLNVTQSQAFAAPPYNFSSTKVGELALPVPSSK